MKNIVKNNYSETLYGVRLFRDDLELIKRSIEKRLTEINISDSSFDYDSIDEIIQEKGYTPKKIEFRAGKYLTPEGVIRFEVERDKCFIHSSGGEESNALFYELKDYISTKVRWDYKVFNPWIWGTLLFSWNSFEQAVKSPPSFFMLTPIALLWIDLFLLFIWAVSLINRRFNFGLNLYRKHEGSFFRRNKDRLILLIVGSVLGSLITILFQYLSSK